MKRRLLRISALFLFVGVLAAFIVCASIALTPYENTPTMQWRAYRQEPARSLDVLFLGSSYAFCDIIPAVIYNESGCSSYVVGAPSMPPRLMEFYLHEALKNQTPSAVFMELTGINYPPYTQYPEMNIGFMPFSMERIKAIFTCVAPEKRAGLLFPLYLYHDEWNTTSLAAVRSRLSAPRPDPAAGYCYRDAAGDIPTDSGLSVLTKQEDLYRANLACISRMAAYCRERGIRFVCYLKADLMPLEEESVAALKKDLTAATGDALFFYGNDYFEEMGLQGDKDFFDPSHMSYSGAKKFSSFLAAYLKKENLVPSPVAKDEDLWKSRVSYALSLETGG